MYLESEVGTTMLHPAFGVFCALDAPSAPAGLAIRVARIPLIPGDAGVDQTARLMVKMIRDAAGDPSIKEAAVKMTAGAGPVDKQAFVRLLRWNLQPNVAFRYVPDTRGAEELWGPEIQAQRYRSQGYAWGDCDDLATWAAALARSLGMGVRLHAAANGRRGREFNHVWADAEVAPGRWASLDTLTHEQAPKYLRERCWTVA